MRLDIVIVRTPFGISNARIATEPHGVSDPWEFQKQKHLRKHLEDLMGNLLLLPGELLSIETQFADVTQPDHDGRTGEWWSVIHFDRRR